jgi:maleylacetate reductase
VIAGERFRWTTFQHETAPMRVIFGDGRITELPAETERLGLHRLLVIASDRALGLADDLRPKTVATFTAHRPHVPAQTVDAAISAVRTSGATGCVAIGGGSAIGLAKSLALRCGLPAIVAPTTFAGSEMTPIWGITGANIKTTGRDPVVLPKAVIYDPELTRSLDMSTAVASALNALAHAAEALYAPDASPVTALLAEEGARAITAALADEDGGAGSPRWRAQLLYGAWLCGTVLGATTMSLHHKLCHVLGGSFSLPHAETHAVVLPHVLTFNLAAAPAAAAALQRVLPHADDAGVALWHLARRAGAPASLRELGMPRDGLTRVRDWALAAPYANPRPVTAAALDRILAGAFDGCVPAP